MNLFKYILPKADNDSHEFKPILAEIEDAPVNPIGNTVFWLIIVCIVVMSLWMYLGKVDIVVTARGIIIPNGEEKIVQSLDKGVVSSIQVQEGDYVHKGDTVAIISPAEHEPGLELNNLKEEEARVAQQLAADREKYVVAQESKQRLDAVKEIITQARYDDVVKEVVSLKHEINALSASLAEIRNKRLQLEKQRQVLKAPIEGYVNKILVHTIGGVVTPAEKIMTIVPKYASFLVKAKVMNQDFGFIEENMPVSIKVDTYNFQKYGILDGKVTVVSHNSVEDEHLGPVYEVYIQPENTTLMVEGNEQSIKYGMTTTNEIKIGKRRIIEFFIYPLIKYMDESIKVR
ncbi:HlyD family efflux transporter periplasmic adaptor subunit [bacterium]|nr:HlyD family efflux transporter periplasmic adaptor subunit [bacterium]